MSIPFANFCFKPTRNVPTIHIFYFISKKVANKYFTQTYATDPIVRSDSEGGCGSSDVDIGC